MTITTDHLRQMLRLRHTGQQWAFFEEVPDSTGVDKVRTADALAMNLWRSEGLHLHGFELKVSRADWRKEMQDPTKSHAIKRFCHRWWLVAPKDVAKLEEIPADWGWYTPTTNGLLRVQRAAAVLTPEPISDNFLASLCRQIYRANKPTEDKTIQTLKSEAYQRGYKDGHTAGKKSAKNDADLNEQMLERVRATIEQFEATSGVKINDYKAGSIGAAVNLVLYLGLEKIQAVISKMAADAKDHAKKWEDAQIAIADLLRQKGDR